MQPSLKNSVRTRVVLGMGGAVGGGDTEWHTMGAAPTVPFLARPFVVVSICITHGNVMTAVIEIFGKLPPQSPDARMEASPNPTKGVWASTTSRAGRRRLLRC